MEIINTFKQSIAKFSTATDKDGSAVENFCNTLFRCIFK